MAAASDSLPHVPPQTPEFWEGLSSPDRGGYRALRARLITPQFANQRGRSEPQFSKLISIIRSYVRSGSPDAAARSLVCGIAWCDKGIAVNSRRLAQLTSKSKSSINGSLQGLGFKALPARQSIPDLVALFPALAGDAAELRKWSLRVTGGQGQDFDPFDDGFTDSTGADFY